MTIKDKLQIVIITYNRAEYLKRTLDDFTNRTSPIREFDILILDNHSNDNTSEVVESYSSKFQNINYIKNNHNVGANANIAKAFEYNQKEYLWIVADDDVYDWSCWDEVEQAIVNNEKAIVISRMDLQEQYKNNIGKVLHQCAFTSACIFHSSLINDTVMRNIYDNVYCMFPHLVPLVTHINNGGNFYVLNNSIVKHGSYENKSSDDVKKEDVFARGAKLEELWRKSRTMQFYTGFAIALSNLKDEKLKHEAIKIQMETQNWQNGILKQKQVLKKLINLYNNPNDITQLADIYLNIDKKNSQFVGKYIVSKFDLNVILNGIIIKYFHINKYIIKCCIYRFLKSITFGQHRKKMKEKYEKYYKRIK